MLFRGLGMFTTNTANDFTDPLELYATTTALYNLLLSSGYKYKSKNNITKFFLDL
jgi:hypothetical protein